MVQRLLLMLGVLLLPLFQAEAFEPPRDTLEGDQKEDPLFRVSTPTGQITNQKNSTPASPSPPLENQLDQMLKPAHEPAASDEISGSDILRNQLTQAWKAYGQNHLDKAEAFFRLAIESEHIPTRQEAQLGLAYTLKKKDLSSQALSIFQKLADQGFRSQETAGQVVELALALGDLENAGRYLDKIPLKLQDPAKQRIQSMMLARKIRQADSDGEKLALVIKEYGTLLLNCKELEQFYMSALQLGKAGRQDLAREIFAQLERCVPFYGDLRLRILGGLASLQDHDTAMDTIEHELGQDGLSATYRSGLEHIRFERMLEHLANLPEDSERFRILASQVLSKRPDDDELRRKLAWSHYRSGEYQQALTHFERLLETGDSDILTGASMSLVKLNRQDDALSLLADHTDIRSAQANMLRVQLNMSLAEEAYKQGHFEKAGNALETVLDIDSDNLDARRLLAYVSMSAGDFELSEEQFELVFRTTGSPDAARNLLMIMDRNNDRLKKRAFLDNLSTSDNPSLHDVAADFSSEHREPLTTAPLNKTGQAARDNCSTPSLEMTPSYRYIEGDRGLDRLMEYALPLRLNHPLSSGEWSFTVTPRFLDAGNAPKSPVQGSFFRTLDESPTDGTDPTDSASVLSPLIGYNLEGRYPLQASLGTTPIGGPLSPLPVFEAKVSSRNDEPWFLELHQRPVDQSLLSWIGLEDPYGDREWGRVVKLGLSGGKTWEMEIPWWISISGGADLYYGQNVEDNDALKGSASIGTTTSWKEGELSYGLFAQVEHFDNNQNFYTFGHGGYFSPDFFLFTGPFLQFETTPSKPYYLDARVSLGLNHIINDDAPRYHDISIDALSMSPAARQDLMSEYEGDTETGLGISASLEGMSLINEYMALGGALAFDNSQDYSEWRMALGLHFFFEPRRVLCSSFDLLTTPPF